MVDARTALVKARHCAQLLRAAGVQLPLIALLNEGGMAAVAASWQVDDIVSDQASPSELDARLRLAIKEASQPPKKKPAGTRWYAQATFVIDTQAYSAHLSGTALNLTFKEFELLKFMAQHPDGSSPRPVALRSVGLRFLLRRHPNRGRARAPSGFQARYRVRADDFDRA